MVLEREKRNYLILGLSVLNKPGGLKRKIQHNLVYIFTWTWLESVTMQNIYLTYTSNEGELTFQAVS